MTPVRRRNVGILVFDNVEVLDFAGPFEVFSRTRLVPGVESRRSDDSAPFHVFTVAPGPGQITATGGLRVVPDHDFANAPHVDLLVVPGGFGTRLLLANETVLEWIRQQSVTTEVMTSVCTGSLLLARAGLLANRRATTHWSSLDALAALDASITVERELRVVDDGIVTSAGVSAGIDMALAVVESLHGRQVADETAYYIEYRRTAPSG